MNRILTLINFVKVGFITLLIGEKAFSLQSTAVSNRVTVKKVVSKLNLLG